MKNLIMVLFGATVLCFGHPAKADVLSADGQATARYFQSLQDNPNAQLVFLETMPKGGDLHNHRSGSAYAENMLTYAAQDDLCFDPTTLAATTKTDCADNAKFKNLPNNSELYGKLIDSWSMRNYVPNPQESGHDHFFSTFLKFIAVSSKHRAENLTEIVNRAGAQHLSYLETMITPSIDKAIAIGSSVGWNDNFDVMRKNVLAKGVATLTKSVQAELNKDEAAMRTALQCGTAHAAPGCKVTVRYQDLALRTVPPEQVFAQLVASFEAANTDPRIVAVNIVGPEDNYYALRDYHLHMQMIDYLHTIYPHVRISLHAGELTLGLVTPEQLAFHIRDAIDNGHASRIGHGDDVAYENNAQQLLHDMAVRHIPVEVCLTSNASILDVRGNQHPLPLYLKNGVPVVLATDDEGVLRTDISHEYQRAAATYRLDYRTMKAFARNSLTYSFLAGKSLWQDPKQFIPVDVCSKDTVGAKKPGADCADYLKQNPKAQLQWQMEMDFQTFEKQMAKQYRAQLAVQ